MLPAPGVLCVNRAIDLELVNLANPTEVRTFPKGRFEVYRVGTSTIGRATYEPGWRWSEHVGADAGAAWCPVAHIGLVISGAAAVLMDDGREVVMGEGDLFSVPPGHDSWVVGEDPYVSLHIMGGEDYAAAGRAGYSARAMTLNPQAQAFFDAGRAAGAPPIWALTPAQAREGSSVIVEMIGDGPAVARVEELQIPVRDAVLAARRYSPEGARGTIVWLHGGGWVFDGLESGDAMCRILANSAAADVVAIDYRVAPEHPFPTPLDDCWDALRWVAEHDDGPLVVGGDSAGGNMSAVCSLRARDAGGPALSAQILVYPVTDHDATRPSYLEHGDSGLLLGAREMQWFFDHYEPDPARRDNPEISPLRAANLRELAPAIVVAAGFDPLHDEVMAYAQRLEEAGVPVSLHRYPDDAHAFFSFVNIMTSGNEAVALVGAEVREMIAAASD